MKSNPTPSEYFNKPILGKIRCQLVGTQNGQPFNTPEDEYEFISVQEQDGKPVVFVVNVWNDEFSKEVQLVPAIFVTERIDY